MNPIEPAAAARDDLPHTLPDVLTLLRTAGYADLPSAAEVSGYRWDAELDPDTLTPTRARYVLTLADGAVRIYEVGR